MSKPNPIKAELDIPRKWFLSIVFKLHYHNYNFQWNIQFISVILLQKTEPSHNQHKINLFFASDSLFMIPKDIIMKSGCQTPTVWWRYGFFPPSIALYVGHILSRPLEPKQQEAGTTSSMRFLGWSFHFELDQSSYSTPPQQLNCNIVGEIYGFTNNNLAKIKAGVEFHAVFQRNKWLKCE